MFRNVECVMVRIKKVCPTSMLHSSMGPRSFLTVSGEFESRGEASFFFFLLLELFILILVSFLWARASVYIRHSFTFFIFVFLPFFSCSRSIRTGSK